MEPEVLGALFLIATVAGWVDAIAGGGGIIILPSLMLTGLSPLQALATNKLQATFGSGTAALHFISKKEVDLRKVGLAILCTFLGASTGTLCVQHINADFLRYLIPTLLIGIALLLTFGLKKVEVARKPLIPYVLFSVLMGLSIGFYDGFFGPGTGTFWAVAHMLLLGYSIKDATINTKVLNFTSNLAALIFFMRGGDILWVTGLVMGAGQMMGAYVGARMVVMNGAKLIKPLLITMSILVSIKLLISA